MKYFYCFFLFLLLYQCLEAQDTIRFRDGKTIVAAIRQVEETRIQYHYYNYPEGPLFVKSINSIAWIRYKNGSIDSFQILKDIVLDSAGQKIAFTRDEIDSIALKDVYENYSGSGPGTGIFLTTLFATPVTGLIATLIATSTPPKTYHLNIPDKPIAENQRYVYTYKEKAYQIKRDKVNSNFAVGLIVTLFASFLVLVAASR